jgi:hypothetical protein
MKLNIFLVMMVVVATAVWVGSARILTTNGHQPDLTTANTYQPDCWFLCCWRGINNCAEEAS